MNKRRAIMLISLSSILLIKASVFGRSEIGGFAGGMFGGMLGSTIANSGRSSETRVVTTSDPSLYAELEKIRYEFNRKIEEVQSSRSGKLSETLLKRVTALEEAVQSNDENKDIEILGREVAALKRDISELKKTRALDDSNDLERPVKRKKALDVPMLQPDAGLGD